jgi:PASTA domain-containing protein/List-Bact-rpt repeat protein
MRWRGPVAVVVFLAALLFAGSAWAGAASPAAIPSWRELTNPPPFNPGAMFLLTDGTVMVQDLGPTAVGTTSWWRLTPDNGSYVNGTWSQVASLPDGYAPHAYAAAVLPDGRLAIEGGEQISGASVWSNLGAIYNPIANTWTMVSPPNGGTGDWTRIGDAPSVVLADGRWLLGSLGTDDAIFDPTNLTWTTTGGVGRIDDNDEAGFTLLPSGKVLSVDVIPPACTTKTTEIFDPATLVWSSAGTTPAPLTACGDLSELGPQLMTYTGKFFVTGATSATAFYDPTSGTWSSGPNLPIVDGLQLSAQDSGAALLPDGMVLVALNSGTFDPPTDFFLFDGSSFTAVAGNTTSSFRNNGNTYMLLLPTGQVLYDTGLGSTSMEVFSEGGSPSPADAPAVASVPTALAAGQTYTLAGTQLNGLSDGAVFGDDYQDSTDFPLVTITNDGTGAVAYARTSGLTNRSIAPGASSCTDFTLPLGIETGTSELRVVANGIASAPVQVTVGAGSSTTDSCPSYVLLLAKAGPGSGTVTSSAAGIDCGATCSHGYPNGTIVTLTASAAAHATFAGWSGGGCSGTGPCVVTMNGKTSVTATFGLVPETLTVSTGGAGDGTVISSPAGIDCGAVCDHAFDYGTPVMLTASPAAGSSFDGWAGDCTGRASCVVAMTGAHVVEASFVKDCVVPQVKGKSLKAANRTIKGHDCSVGRIKRAFSQKVKKGRVISQKPKPHKLLQHGARVDLVVSRGKKPE